MKNLFILLCSLFVILSVQAQENREMLPQDTEDWSKKPVVITSEAYGKLPSDAIMIYGGKSDFHNWKNVKGETIAWKTKGRKLIAVGNTGNISTRQAFGDVQLHLEWASPRKVEGEGQGRGNSGVFLMGLYEVQVLDSYDNETYYNGQAGSVYKQYVPLANACRKPGKWQTYDIFFTAPKFSDDKKLVSPAYLTVVHNGILVQNHVELKGPTAYIGQPNYVFHAAKLPLMLQDHGNPVSYRNIWVREL